MVNRTRVIGAQVPVIWDTVAIAVWGTAQDRMARLARTGVILIADPIAVAVWTATLFGGPIFVGTGVVAVEDAITVRISGSWAAVCARATRLSRTGVSGVSYPVAVAVRGPLGPSGARFLG
jgi:hypothetical protein